MEPLKGEKASNPRTASESNSKESSIQNSSSFMTEPIKPLSKEMITKPKTSSNSNSKEISMQNTPSKMTTTTKTTSLAIPISNTESDKHEEREGFGNGVESVLTCLGLAVGLGNVWRFPTKAYENGGSAFLIPYIICAIVFGLPSIYFKFMIGQYDGKSPPIIFRRIMPFWHGVGWLRVSAAIIIGVYYIVIVSWISIYIANIFRGDFNVWTRCDNEWNVADTCINMLMQKECRVNQPPGWENATHTPEKMFYINGTCQNASLFEGVEMVSATEQYFMRHIINPSAGLYDFSGINWPILIAMTVCWILTALGILKGAKIMGKISYVSVLLPYFIVIVLFIRGITLPGASDGLYYYLGKPDYSKLFVMKTWIEALIQLCFSLSVGNGGLISLASYSPKNNNVFRDALIVIIGDTLMSLIGGAAVFSTLGFLAQQRGVAVPDVVKDGLSLAFVVYPEAITQMPLPWLWSFLFFFMLFLLGASTEIVLVDGICACIYDQSRKARNNKWKVVIAWCLFFYVCGFVFSTKAGVYWFEMLDEYVAGFSSVCAVVAELVVVMFVYGFRNVRDDIKQMFGKSNNESRQTAGWDDVEKDKREEFDIIRHLLHRMTTRGLHQEILQNVIVDFLEVNPDKAKKKAISVRRLFKKILTSDEIGLIDGLGNFEKCCLLHVMGMKVPPEFREKMKKQLVIDENGFVRTIMIPGRERVDVYHQTHQSLTAKHATSQSMPAPNNTAQTTPTPDVISPSSDTMMEGPYMRCSVENLKKKKIKNAILEIYDLYQEAVHEKSQTIEEIYKMKMLGDHINAKVHKESYFRSMEQLYSMIHLAAVTCTPGERAPVCPMVFVIEKVHEILTTNGFVLTSSGNRMWNEMKDKAGTYGFIKKSSIVHTVAFLLETF